MNHSLNYKGAIQINIKRTKIDFFQVSHSKLFSLKFFIILSLQLKFIIYDLGSWFCDFYIIILLRLNLKSDIFCFAWVWVFSWVVVVGGDGG